MPKTKKFVDAYFRFLNLAQAVHSLPTMPKLEAAEERLLELLASAWSLGKAYSVSEAMQLEAAGSPATVYRKLQQLQKRGLIEIQISPDDPRVKRMVPSRQALAYFEKLARCLEKAQPR